MGLSIARRCAAIAMVSCALLAAGAARASADLASGTWAFDGRVSELVRDPATGAVFAGGTFTREQAPVGGLFATGADGEGTPQPLPAVDGAVTAVAADGHGGWYVAWLRSTPFAPTLVAGQLTVRWLPGHTLVASARATLTRPGTRTVHIRLTRAGRRLLRHAKRLRLTGRATFGGAGVRRTFTLRL